jgi:aspartyl-tRNA(Asn)/glutamyl-tRNA(Gln) amidotransferase subunit A
MEIAGFTISQTHDKLKKKEFSALELCQAFLGRIKEKDREIRAFLSVDEESALLQAKKVDGLISGGKEVPLLVGLPAAIKDNILVKGQKCTAGSKILENYVAPYDATAVEKLRNQGVVFLGKTNLDEFGMGSSTENSAFGPTHNPHDLSRVPGGTSGGSAAATAAEMTLFSLGSDTGGSIRQPSSFCGVVGLRPTYGSVSRYGLIAFTSSMDQIGPIARTVDDVKVVFEAISGKDRMDSTSLELPKNRESKLEIKNLKIGVPKEYFVKGIDPEVEKVIRGAIKKYEEGGAMVEEVSLPHTEYALAAYYLINPSEASTNLARYDGIKYGFSEKGKDLMEVYFKSRGEGLGPEVRRRIMLGTYALSAGYYEAYYLQAQKVRTKVIEDFKKVFEKVDVLMTPVSPVLPFKLGEKVEDPLSMYLVDIYTVSLSLAGLPALSLPVGKVGKLPVGLQIIGRPFEENKILEVGKIFEKQWKI